VAVEGENLKIWNPDMLVRGADGQFFIFPVFQFPARTGCVEILTPAQQYASRIEQDSRYTRNMDV